MISLCDLWKVRERRNAQMGVSGMIAVAHGTIGSIQSWSRAGSRAGGAEPVRMRLKLGSGDTEIP
jgi:hypothetical protein